MAVRHVDILMAISKGIDTPTRVADLLYPAKHQTRSPHGGPSKGEVRAAWEFGKLERKKLIAPLWLDGRSSGVHQQHYLTLAGHDVLAALPERTQLSRRKGSKRPEGTVQVSRPSLLGNPFYACHGNADRKECASWEAVSAFKIYIDGILENSPAEFREEERPPGSIVLLAKWNPFFYGDVWFWGARLEPTGSAAPDLVKRISILEALESILTNRKLVGCWCDPRFLCHADVIRCLDVRKVRKALDSAVNLLCSGGE